MRDGIFELKKEEKAAEKVEDIPYIPYEKK